MNDDQEWKERIPLTFMFERNQEFDDTILRLQSAVSHNPDEHYPVVRASDLRYILQLLSDAGMIE